MNNMVFRKGEIIQMDDGYYKVTQDIHEKDMMDMVMLKVNEWRMEPKKRMSR